MVPLPCHRQPIHVVAHAGYRGEEEPRAIEIERRRLHVDRVVQRWRDPHGRYFRVETERGDRLLLYCREPDLSWWAVSEGPGG